MAMFSYDMTSRESRLGDVLQSKFFRTARRNKILAKWVGGRLGYKEAALNKYVRSLVLFYLTLPNDRRMIDKILSDFQKANIRMSTEIIESKIKAIEERIYIRQGTKYVG